MLAVHRVARGPYSDPDFFQQAPYVGVTLQSESFSYLFFFSFYFSFSCVRSLSSLGLSVEESVGLS